MSNVFMMDGSWFVILEEEERNIESDGERESVKKEKKAALKRK